MRLCHSLWTLPLLSAGKKRLKANIWLFALSVAYARQMEETSIVLHTDRTGKKLLDFLPYDELYVTLDDITTPTCFWATGKIIAQSLEPQGSIHLDGDVFLKKRELKEKLDFRDYDVLLQHQEPINSVYRQHAGIFDYFHPASACPAFEYGKSIRAVNCGIVGFNNSGLKAAYIKRYLETVKLYAGNRYFLNYCRSHSGVFTPDLIVEQKNLAILLSECSSRTKYLFPRLDYLQQNAVKEGYTHLLGQSKYKLIELVQQRLQETDKLLYRLAEKKVSSL